jgi:hypothetical protein
MICMPAVITSVVPYRECMAMHAISGSLMPKLWRRAQNPVPPPNRSILAPDLNRLHAKTTACRAGRRNRVHAEHQQ